MKKKNPRVCVRLAYLPAEWKMENELDVLQNHPHLHFYVLFQTV